MLIMIMFLSLSGVLLITTVIYTSHKKKSNKITTSTKKTIDNHKKQSKKKLSDILKLEIKDNIICVDNRYSVIIQLGNIDYNMLSNKEQEIVENILIQTALSIDYPIQFFSTTEYINTSKIISIIKENKTQNYKIQEYKKHLITYLQNIMENRIISVVKSYAIISYDGLEDKANEELNRICTSFKNSLLGAKIVCEVLDKDELYNLIYRELNKNSNLNINLLKNGGKNLYVDKKQKTKRNRHI